MRWEIKDNTPKIGDVRFRTRFAFLPTIVLSKITMTDHIVWLELYLEEQVYSHSKTWNGDWEKDWQTVAKTIHI